ncbi:type II toxin-antitoxin system VapB family antitoxin [Rhodoferax sp. WC2427]|jgi:Arc/MetJ family transcription regulator|uniref:type II toxin-antitoxin system VapB family antitoxin n=1 Tax=Rhodoferax sp. WC2427 TaxID=3234144 RepID=UPI003466190D
MRTNLTLDESLLAQAQKLSGLNEHSALVNEALRALIERESARQLALLGGTVAEVENVPRRNWPTT